MSLIIDTVRQNLPYRHKNTPSGWISFNAICCHHNGNSKDTRNRGGMIFNGDSISYHCFNCQFKTSWQPGRTITPKFKKMLQWLGVNDDLITKCSLESLKLKRELEKTEYQSYLPNFSMRELPEHSLSLKEWTSIMKNDVQELYSEQFIAIVSYLISRGFSNPFNYDFYWTPNYPDRVIIPFRYHNQIVGYTARRITNNKPKYISEQQPGYIFNIDNQDHERKFVIVCEGPFDAISIDGIAILGSELSDRQKLLIDTLRKEVIVVPDQDQDGHKIIEQAIEWGWTVSFPEWEDCKDINEAVVKYGRIKTLFMILKAKQQTELKIRLHMKYWFRGDYDV